MGTCGRLQRLFDRIILTVIFIWSSLSCASQEWQPLPGEIHKSAKDLRSYQAIRLNNDMTMLLISDPNAPKALAALTLPVGSLDDPDNQLGLAHYLEHMVLMGSKRYPESGNLAEFLKKNRGNYNASTALYRTSYYLEVDNKGLEDAVDRLADAIAEPLLDVNYADKERNAVNAELTMARSRDGMRMAQVRAETLNPKHPASRFAGGNLETLKDKPGSVLHQTLTDFYQRYYSANLMKGILYGNQSLPQLADIAAKTFGRIANHQTDAPTIDIPAITPEQEGLIIHYVPVQPQKLLRLEFYIDNNSAEFRSKSDLYISYLIGNRSKNTLSDWLQRQGLADRVTAGSDAMVYRNGGIFSISVSLTDKGLKKRDEVIAAVFSYLKLLRQHGIKRNYFNEISHVLNLEFRYPSINRNMDYIEWLSDMLLRVPMVNALDAPYLADKYDPKAIAARLDQLTPQNARVWFISPEEPHNKVAYFVNAPYQVDKIKRQRFTQWLTLAKNIKLTLPQLNPYVPNDFSVINKGVNLTHPEKAIEQPGLRALYMPSRYFADEPKADVRVVLRNPILFNSARNQVLFFLTNYLAELSLAQLKYQASVGGLYFSSDMNAGLMLSANGFTQRMPQLLLSLIDGYQHFKPTEEQFAQAKSWYLEYLAAADKVKAFELAMQPIQMLSFVPYFERNERRAWVDKLTLQDMLAYRDNLIKNAAIDIIAIGNMNKQQVADLAVAIKQHLNNRGLDWWYGKTVVVDNKQLATLQRAASSTDSALAAVYVPTNYSEINGKARSLLLGRIIQPWFYNQLRTEEQLGYAVFSFAITVGEQSGIGFLLQSNNQQPAYLYQRYLDFYQKAKEHLSSLTLEDFEQYRKASVNELKQQPQTLTAEASRFSSDFNRGNFAFDSRDLLISQLETLKPADLAEFFQQAVLNTQGLAILSQVSGSSQEKSDYAAPTGWKQYADATHLQQALPSKVVAQ